MMSRPSWSGSCTWGGPPGGPGPRGGAGRRAPPPAPTPAAARAPPPPAQHGHSGQRTPEGRNPPSHKCHDRTRSCGEAMAARPQSFKKRHRAGNFVQLAPILTAERKRLFQFRAAGFYPDGRRRQPRGGAGPGPRRLFDRSRSPRNRSFPAAWRSRQYAAGRESALL
jgi:hypothetical protein